MARFYEVHRRLIDAARDRIQPYDIWNVAVREPLGAPSDKPTDTCEETITVIQYRMRHDRVLEPANEGTRTAIAEWEERHRDTPNSAFDWYPTFR